MGKTIAIRPGTFEEVVLVEVVPQQTVGSLMNQLGYDGSTLKIGEHCLDLDMDIGSASAGTLFPEENGSFDPFRLGSAE